MPFFSLQLMDFYSASGIPILWCCFFQTIAIGWIFGANKFGDCVAQMTGYQPHKYWIWTWGVIAPVVMAVSNLTLFPHGGILFITVIVCNLTKPGSNRVKYQNDFLIGSKSLKGFWNVVC